MSTDVAVYAVVWALLAAPETAQPIAPDSTQHEASRDTSRLVELAQMLARLEKQFDAEMEVVASKGLQGNALNEERYSVKKRFFSAYAHDAHKRRDLIQAIVAADDNAFTHSALIEVLDIIARDDSRHELVSLLSQRCPMRVGYPLSIEGFLIIECREHLKDGVLVLCDAFDRSRSRLAKDEISDALRRGLQFTGVTAADDASFVNKCREWYIANRDQYEPNMKYVTHLMQLRFPYSTQGALIHKSQSKEREAPQRPPSEAR
jgi:hypothetical protein